MCKIPFFGVGVGNLVYNSDFRDRNEKDGELYPVKWKAHSEYIQGMVYENGEWAIKSAYEDTPTSSSYYACIPIHPGDYTCYGMFKPYDLGANGRYIMHSYSSRHSTSFKDEAFWFDYDLVEDEWVEVISHFKAPCYSSYLHFSPRSQDENHCLFKRPKLARGIKTIEEMRQLKELNPVQSNIQHIYELSN